VRNDPSAFKCDHRTESTADALRVYLRGQLVYETLDSIESCWEVVRAGPRPSVVLDLSEVDFMGSAALGSLLGLRRWLESRGCCLRISAMSAEIRRVLEVTGLNRILPIDDGAREAAA
jgi:anti-anti-sigma factor